MYNKMFNFNFKTSIERITFFFSKQTKKVLRKINAFTLCRSLLTFALILTIFINVYDYYIDTIFYCM